MSGRRNPPGDKRGYGNPPRQHQFPPGVSGNPKGRPKGAKGKRNQLLDAMDQPTRQMFMAEMTRPVKVTIDGKTVTMSTIQMITRAMAKSAASGGQQAQRTALLVQLELEKQAAAEKGRILADVREYKMAAGPIFARCRAQGMPEPELYPHPDDIFIDEDTQRAEIRGPRNAEQKAALDKFLAQRDSYQRGVTGHQEAAAANPREWDRLWWASQAQQRYDMINDRLPERYRRPLENRMSPAQIEAATKKARKGVRAQERRRERRRQAKLARTPEPDP